MDAGHERKDRRDAAQVLFIGLKLQAELLEALLIEGALSPRAARPLAAHIEIVAGAWLHSFEEGEGKMADTLRRLRERIGAPRE